MVEEAANPLADQGDYEQEADDLVGGIEVLRTVVERGEVEAGGRAKDAEYEANGLEHHVELDVLEDAQREDTERENDEPCKHHDESVTWVGKVVVRHNTAANQSGICVDIVKGDGVISAAMGSFRHVHFEIAVVGVSSQRAAQRSSGRIPAFFSECEDKGLCGAVQIERVRCEVCAALAGARDKVHAILVRVVRTFGRSDHGEFNGVRVGGFRVAVREAWG